MQIARHRERVSLDVDMQERHKVSREFVDRALAERKVIYGVTTGFGSFKNVVISPEQVEKLQRNLIMSHAIGTVEPMPEEWIRAPIVILINSLLHGYSGVRLEIVKGLINMLNHDIYPYVPSQGSVGSSGDLAPLSHIALTLLGEGEVLMEGKRAPSLVALNSADLKPMTLQAKEGLALNNGTAVQTGIGCLALADAEWLSKLTDAALAMTLESVMGSVAAYDQRIHALRPYVGQSEVACNIRSLCAHSAIIASHANCGRVQDSYSIRCAPQVHGACRDGIRYVRSVLEIEINSVTDNPLLFPDDNEAISGGNFHGEPIALAMDHLKLCASELANISERRTAKMMDPTTSEGLPAFLIPAKDAGLNSGYMIAQYTAAALVSENKVLAHPASVDSILTSANQEDHVSMGTIAARQAAQIVKNATTVIAIELLCAAQALDLRKPLEPGSGTKAIYTQIRSIVSTLTEDRILYPDLERLRARVVERDFLNAVETTVGALL